MMLNLFEVFDPSTLYFSLNWMSNLIGLLIFPQIYWLKISRLIWLMNMLMINLWIEFKMLLINKFNYLNLMFFLVLFFYIMLNNLFGLFSYIFTSSSHMLFSLWMSISVWLMLMLYGWLNNMEFMFIHLVPSGTPFFLMFFMVLIETLSNLIRPLTLSIRLTANMIAGHLLLVLLSIFILDLMQFYMIILIFQILLMMLEIGVSIIQSYVFVILMILYLKETN
uniref:ATP synthase subunit a n=1 Tax=Macrocentrus camphoraphilus TaxID=684659 RepID=D8WHC9_9HYME|nr:ATP synthase F0 subunit 6 [Macrocentrus camphoraphilus]